MIRKYSEEELTHAILLILDRGMTPTEVSKATGINLRALQRYKRKYVDEKEIPDYVYPGKDVILRGEVPLMSTDVQQKLDKTILVRVKFLDDLFATKQVLLKQINKIGAKSQNLDALHRALKTVSDLENVVTPDGDTPAVQAKTVNMFQFFNQQLIANGYKGPELSDADIVKGD